MSTITVYSHPRCTSCKSALKFLEENKIPVEVIDITTQAPSESELRAMLDFQNGALKKLFNTSGLQYKELGLKDRLPELSEQQALSLLANNGMLVKRPFLLGSDVGLVGFDAGRWSSALRANR